MRHIATLFTLVTLTSVSAGAQVQPADTVIVPLGRSSKIIFTIEDRRDLEILRHYNFQELFNDIFDKLEGNDSTAVAREKSGADERVVKQDTITAPKITEYENKNDVEEYTDHSDEDDDDDNGKWTRSRRGGIGRTWQSYNIDLGTNNYIADSQFPDGSEPYAVRPWGSWYVGINSVQRTKLGRNVFAEWSLGVSWYSFKFQQDNTTILADETGVHFIEDMRDVGFSKSKLSATFINASLVPVLDFGEHSRKPRIWEGHGDGFRLGIGPYVGYRISSKTKLVYEEDGKREKQKDHDSFYLNNLRYGVRIQIGVRSTDLFINYDMNELFVEGKGPRLNAISFGLIL